MKYVDMHCDTIGEIHERQKKGENISLRESSLHIDLNKLKKGDCGLQNFGLFVHLGREDPVSYTHLIWITEVFISILSALHIYTKIMLWQMWKRTSKIL